MTKRHWAMLAAACTLILGALACATPDTTSGPETAQAAQLTVIAGLTQANIQLTPDDSKATLYAGFLQTSIANQVLMTQGAQGGVIGTAVAQTIQASVATPQPPPATITVGPAQPTSAQPTVAQPTQNPNAGAVSGKICYPAAIVPALTVFARDLGSGAVFKLVEPVDQHQYTLGNLPDGNYYLFAYTQAGPGHASVGIAYTQFVACGMSAACTDHSLVAVAVAPGETTPGIDLCDGAASDIPAQPQ